MPKKPTATFVRDIRENCKTVDEAVDAILLQCGICDYPIDLDIIANEMGINLFKVGFKDKSLMGILVDNDTVIESFNSQRFIAVKCGSYYTRKRFTIAHEIAHYILHCDETNNYYERNQYDELSDRSEPEYVVLAEDKIGNPYSEMFTIDRSEPEVDADFFAASLLMPTQMVKDAFQETNENKNLVQRVKKLAEQFNASYKVALYRLRALDLV